jgi:hypothetical protein
MRGLLVKVGMDRTIEGWSPPCLSDGRFCYVPRRMINIGDLRHGSEAAADEFDLALQSFAPDRPDFSPARLPGTVSHLDPDFQHLRFGDSGQRSRQIIQHFADSRDNFIAFYASFMPIDGAGVHLTYALIGLFRFARVVHGRRAMKRLRENAVGNRDGGSATNGDIMIYADPMVSGRLVSLVPIGEWRKFAYRLREPLLELWGGISSRDGYIQRDACVPHFLDPEKFLRWFHERGPVLVAQNNIG